jgi:ribosomal protein S12 methylthiotransferase
MPASGPYNIKMRVNLLSLGCLKNTADSETLIRRLMSEGFVYTDDPENADVLLVNTCGFIEDAKRESIEEILNLAGSKSGGQRLVVFGCLVERYRDVLKKEVPEADALFGLREGDAIAGYLRDLSRGKVATGRVLAGGNGRWQPALGLKHVAPLKVAEGCNRRCTFCAIPSIRGRFRSRDPEEVLRDAQSYVKAGVRELVLVAQDLTAYGRELGGYGLRDLVKDMASIGGDFWIRLHYLYPTALDKGLLELIPAEEKVVKYVDMPLQHSEDRVLRAMGRAGTRKGYMELIRKVRDRVPGAALRTAFIVGFPGESKLEFEGLLGFVEEAGFERLGAFMYSREEGTRASHMKGHIPGKVKEKRLDALMCLQAGISLGKNRALVGRRLRVLVDSVDGDTATARTGAQALEIDGATYVSGAEGRGLKPGDFVEIEVTSASHYDLEGVCL